MLKAVRTDIIFTIILGFVSLELTAQDTTKSKALNIGGYIETYYLYDFNKPINNTVPLAYNHNRHNEFSVNLALLSAIYSTDIVRGNLAFQTGSYPESNYAIEPLLFQSVYDANIGVKIHKRIWLDAGIFGSSHIGFESAISTNNWTLTRSLSAENTPYYETGAKLSYQPDSQLLISILMLNGWQNIRDLNNNKAFGSQITWKPNNKLTLNSSTFIGNEKPDTVFQYRYFHNFYATYKPVRKTWITLGFDIGTEQERDSVHQKLTGKYNTWYNPTLIIRYSIHQKVNIAVRGKFFHDEKNVIIPVNQVTVFSANVDYMPYDKVMIRAEYRHLSTSEKTFSGLQGMTNYNRPTLAVSMLASF